MYANAIDCWFDSLQTPNIIFRLFYRIELSLKWSQVNKSIFHFTSSLPNGLVKTIFFLRTSFTWERSTIYLDVSQLMGTGSQLQKAKFTPFFSSAIIYFTSQNKEYNQNTKTIKAHKVIGSQLTSLVSLGLLETTLSLVLTLDMESLILYRESEETKKQF